MAERTVRGDGRGTASLGRSMTRMGRVGVGSAAWMGAAWTQRAAEAAAEVTRFTTHRLVDDLRTQGEMLRCRDLAALQSVQGRYVQRLIDQYAAETVRLLRLANGAEPASDALAAEERETNGRASGRGRAYDNIPF